MFSHCSHYIPVTPKSRGFSFWSKTIPVLYCLTVTSGKSFSSWLNIAFIHHHCQATAYHYNKLWSRTAGQCWYHVFGFGLVFLGDKAILLQNSSKSHDYNLNGEKEWVWKTASLIVAALSTTADNLCPSHVYFTRFAVYDFCSKAKYD